jgi:multiple sugar transport system substrate-binding protein
MKTILLIALFISALGRGFAQSPVAGVRLAGDEWFLESLVKTQELKVFEAQTGIRVEVLSENDPKIMSDLDRSGKPESALLDVIVVRHRWLGTLAEKKQVIPIDSFLTDPKLEEDGFDPRQQLFPGWWQGLSSYGNHVYGFPYTLLTTFLCYRKDLLEDAANRRDFQARYHRELVPPKSWREYNQLAEFFTRPKEHFYGTYIQGKQGLPLWYEWLNFIYSFGGNILDTKHGWEYGDIVVNSPQNVEATKQYLSEIAFSPPDTLAYGWDQAQSALQQGHVFMGFLWTDQAPFLEEPAVSKVSGKIGYSLIPSESGKPFTQQEGLTYFIPSESKHPREAYRLLEFLMSEPVQEAQTLKGSLSARKSVYDSKAVADVPYVSTFLAGVPFAIEKSTIPDSPEMTEAAVKRLSEIVNGKSSPQAGLDNLALDLQRIVGQKSRLRYPVTTRP